MGRIGATLSGVERMLLNRMADANAAAVTNTLRLATGKRVNSPADDISAFIGLSHFQTQLTRVTATMKSVTAAGSVITQTQSTLGLMRTQLDNIRTELLTDEGQTLTAEERAEAQATIDTAITQINSLATTAIDGRKVLDGSGGFNISGRNGAQVTDLVVHSTGGVGQIVPGEYAELTYTGNSRYAAADATVKFTGNIGSTTIAFTTGDTLEDVAQAINDRSNTTGVVASVDDNTLTLSSAEMGAGEAIAVQVQAGTFNVTGGNGDNTANGVDVVYGSTDAVSGSVDRAATRAQLVYTGTTAQISGGDGGDLTITGALGSEVISVADAELLTDVATKINNQSHKTGITAYAAVGSDTLTFSSVDYGSDATAAVSADSAFSVTGGNGDGTAQGSDMIATIGGITYSPAKEAELRHRESTGLFTADADIRVTGYLGFADFSITNGNSLALIASTINAQKNSTGVEASVDGNDLVLKSTITGTDGHVDVEVTGGAFDTVTDYTPASSAELIYTGTDGELSADADFRLTGTGLFDFSFSAGELLADVAQDINDETATTGVEAVVQGDQLILRTVATGSTASMSVTNVVGEFTVAGGNGDGTADGTNSTASDTGVDEVSPNATLDGNRISINRNGSHFEIEFAGSFTGTFNTISVSGDAMTFALGTDVRRRDRLAIPSVQAAYLGGISGKLSDLLAGGSAAGLDDNTAQAIRIVDEALADLTRIEGSVDGFYNAAITSSSNLLDAMQKHLEGDADEGTEGIISQTDGYNSQLEALLLAKNQQLASNAEAGLAILSQQRMGIVEIIRQIAGLD
jgi:flagellin-like hook-associated protein FlgL